MNIPKIFTLISATVRTPNISLMFPIFHTISIFFNRQIDIENLSLFWDHILAFYLKVEIGNFSPFGIPLFTREINSPNRAPCIF